MTAFSGNWFQQRSARRRAASEAYRRLLRQALEPVYYLEHGVPDTFEGRAGMVTLLTSVACVRLSGIDGPEAPRLMHRLNDLVLDGFDAAYREKGVGDASIARKVRVLAEGHAGLGKVLFAELSKTNPSEKQAAVAEILIRNGMVQPGLASGLAQALMELGQRLGRQPAEDILHGRLDWTGTQGSAGGSAA